MVRFLESKQQQKFMGIVRAIQKGDEPASKFSKDAQDAADDMKKKDVEHEYSDINDYLEFDKVLSPVIYWYVCYAIGMLMGSLKECTHLLLILNFLLFYLSEGTLKNSEIIYFFLIRKKNTVKIAKVCCDLLKNLLKGTKGTCILF